jgi:hypothetical protein
MKPSKKRNYAHENSMNTNMDKIEMNRNNENDRNLIRINKIPWHTQRPSTALPFLWIRAITKNL